MSAVFGKCLLIDNNVNFVEEVQSSDLLQQYPLQIVRTLEEGQKFFQKNKASIRAVILSAHLFSDAKTAAEAQLYFGIPTLFLNHSHLDPKIIDQSTHLFVKTPKSYHDVIAVLEEHVFKKANWNEFKESHDEKFVEVVLQDKDYAPIKIDEFIFSKTSQFNIFIKIGKEKFVKIVNAGESSPKEIVHKYRDKGFANVHIPITEHDKYLALVDDFTKKLGALPVEAGTKVNSVIRLGTQVMQNFMSAGIEAKKMDMAESFLNQSVGLIKSLDVRDGNLKKFIEQIESNDHSAAVSFMAGAIANELGFESLKSVKTVGLAALVHDIGLYDLYPDEDEAEVYGDSASEVYMNHAKHGAEMLRKTQLFDEVVCLAVEHHHYRRRGNDPLLKNQNVNLIAEVIGVSDAFYNLVIKGGFTNTKLQYFVFTELKNFSLQIEKSVMYVLDEKSKKSG